MKKRLLNNPGLKIAAVVIAFLIWLVIVNVNDSVQTRTIYNVPVQVLNSSYIESLGQSYSIAEGNETISVRVKGNRSSVEPLTAEDITATIDMTEIVSFESSKIMVPVRVTAGDIPSSNISANPETVEIDLDELVSESFVVTGTTGDTKPASGYQVGRLTPEIEKVTVTGPSSVVSVIDRIEAPVDVTDISEDTILSAHLHVYDKNGEELTDNSLSGLRFSVENDSVMVGVTLYRVLSDVQVEVAGSTGTPAAGYQVMGMTATPSTISVAGSEEALSAFAEVGSKITVDASLVDVTGAETSFDVRIEDLSSLLPDGLVLAEGTGDSLIVSVEILPYNSVSVKYSTSSIEKQNAGKDLDYIFAEATVDIPVRGSDLNLSKATAENLQVSVDLKGLKAGTHEVTLDVTLPDGLELLEPVTVSVTVSERESNTQKNSSESSETTKATGR